MSPTTHTPPVEHDSLETVVAVGRALETVLAVGRAAFLVRATVLAVLEFSLDPPQAASAIAATASGTNFSY